MEKKKLNVSNTPYDGGRWITDGGWWVTDGGWWVTDGGWCVTDGGWWVTDGGWCVTDGGWCVTDGGWWVTNGGWWVATKHQRVDAIVKKKKKVERPYGTPWGAPRPPGGIDSSVYCCLSRCRSSACNAEYEAGPLVVRGPVCTALSKGRPSGTPSGVAS